MQGQSGPPRERGIAMKAGTRYLLMTLAVSTLAGAARADAPQEFRVFRGLREVPDHALDQMRGRFITDSGIISFGIAMESQWRTSSGEVYGAGLELQLASRSGPILGGPSTPEVSFRPSFTLVSSQDKVASVQAAPGFSTSSQPLQDSGGNASVGGNGLLNVTGVTQGIHVAADANRVNNNLSLDIILKPGQAKPETQPVALATVSSTQSQGTPAAGSLPGGTGAVNASAAIAEGVTNAGLLGSGETLIVTTDQGVKLSSGIGGGGAIVAIELPGQGRILQSIGGGLFSATGIRQNAEVVSQLNAIQNSTRITVQMLDTGASTNFTEAFSKHTLYGLRQIGSMF